MSKSTPPTKPAKPYPDFPLFPHATRRWAKKIKGRMVYFGPWDDPDGALKKYLEQRDDLYAGRRPRRPSDVLTVRELCNAFLTSKRRLVDSGELTIRTFDTYYRMCKRIVEHFGRDRPISDLRPDDFGRLCAEMARRYGPVTLRSRMQVVRVVFNFAFGSHLFDRPVNYGQEFQKPSKKTVRLAKAEQGLRMFEPHELRRTLDVATFTHRAMILLGVNAGLGNTDVGRMRFSHIDLDAGWLNYPRQKTGVVRAAPCGPRRSRPFARPPPPAEAEERRRRGPRVPDSPRHALHKQLHLSRGRAGDDRDDHGLRRRADVETPQTGGSLPARPVVLRLAAHL